MQIAQSPTRTAYPLSEKKIIKKSAGSIIGSLFSIGTVLAMLLILPQTAPYRIWIIAGGLTIFFLLALGGYVYQVWYFRSYFYDLMDNFVVIKKGVFANREITIPYLRIQDVYVDQDLLDRVFDLYDVHLSSATISSGFEAHIDGLTLAGANGIKMTLLSKLQAVKASKVPQQTMPPATAVQTGAV